MYLYCIKCSIFTKTNSIKINSFLVDCSFEKLGTIDKEELRDLLKVLL